eukprot:29937_1
MANLVDWSLNNTSLEKKLLQLRESKLIKACKHKNVSYRGNKKDMIRRILKANDTNIQPKCDNNKQFRLNWQHISNAIKHELYDKVAYSLMEIIKNNKKKYKRINNENINNVVKELKTKHKMG